MTQASLSFLARTCFMGLFLCLMMTLRMPLSQAQVAGGVDVPAAGTALTVIAIGDAGETGGILRGNAQYLTEMYTGAHDGGRFQAMVFLGNNFEGVGLNVPLSRADGTVASVLGPYEVPFAGIGRERIHAIPGNQDYYSRYSTEEKFLFGLFSSSRGPSGFSDKGNVREAALPMWSYHSRWPASIRFPVTFGGADSVEFIFFDSALLLRTPPTTWATVLDSLRALLGGSAPRSEVSWRILCVHHPLNSVGEHGGYSFWSEEDSLVQYVSPCDRDSNAGGWLRNWMEADDICADRYRQYADSLRAAVAASGASIQAVLSAHDHSLQLLYQPEDEPQFPRIQIISGAGSAVGRVKLPDPPRVLTSSQRDPLKEGYSVPGFCQLQFSSSILTVRFFNGKNGDVIDMGGGKREIRVNRRGEVE